MYMTKTIKTLQKKLLTLNPMKNMQKKMKFFTKSNNMQKVLFLVGLLLILFFVHKYFLAKEGFASSVDELEDNMSKQKSMVLFYADWCGHCKNFLPKWDQMSSSWNNSNENVKMIKVECGKPDENNAHRELMEKYEIEGYPTILVFKDGKATKYEGKRDENSLLSYLNGI